MTANPKLPKELRSVLRGLRTRIQVYVLGDGLGACLLWLGIAFWATLGLDYWLEQFCGNRFWLEFIVQEIGEKLMN